MCAAHILATRGAAPPHSEQAVYLLLLQTVSFSEETKDEINLDLLDDVAWHQIQKLTVNHAAAAALKRNAANVREL